MSCFHVFDANSRLRFSTRDHSPVEVCRSIQPSGIMEEQVSTSNGSSCNREMSLLIPELGPPEFWDLNPFLSLPVDPCKSIAFADPSAYLL